MKKSIALCLVAVSLGALTIQAAKADEVWFSKWDRDHNHQWTYTEFRGAYYDWARRHHEEHRLKEAELRAEFNRLDAEHHGWVTPEQVHEWRHWD